MVFLRQTSPLTDALALSAGHAAQPVGLPNVGSTCFMNAVLQVWFQCARFNPVLLGDSKKYGISPTPYSGGKR